MNDSYTVGPARVAFGDGTARETRLRIERGRVAAVLDAEGPSDFSVAPGVTLAPGMIDVHTNGAEDFLFNRDQGNAVDVAARSYAKNGVTGYVAGIITAPWESMLHAGSEIYEAASQLEEQNGAIGARCLGIHFEGPFLNPKFRRVHRGEWIVPATMERAQEMIETCRGALVLVTMA
ncbi:MAG: hypothetical protein JO359_10455, partial [Candidatus Eremiobacteraeota bacterium]|nr:hypothetical protein [Candidatus Eremiobacteraeota bacterium]